MDLQEDARKKAEEGPRVGLSPAAIKRKLAEKKKRAAEGKP
jgi:hypothetical protein